MLEKKKMLIALMLLIVILLIPNMVKAEETSITVQRNVYSMDGSMKFTFSGLTIDTTHEYEYGLTKIAATAVEDWYLVTENTATSVTVNIMTGTKEMREIINSGDIGYITIKDKTTDTIVLEPYAVDLKTPYLMVSNYEVVSNGQDLTNAYEINVPLRNASNSEAYYKYEKITDQNIINKYKEIKAKNGEYIELQSMIKTNAPTSGYSTWGYWNGHGSDGRNGFGYTTKTVNAPDTGLYYLWLYFSGESIKNFYGCIIVDNLEADIAVDSVSLPVTKTVELGKTLTLTPTFNPSTATNKIVTWSSSDETVATVDNAGKITPKKVGSTIIKVTTQDGNKTATCTVTVTATINGNQDEQQDTDDSKKTFGNHTYQIIDKLMSWQEAKEYCESLGGYLVTITSAEEQAFIASLVKEQGFTQNRFWIGATDKDKEGTWKWITGEKFSYSNWGNTQPNNGEAGGQNYGAFVSYDTSYNGIKLLAGQWDDIKEDGDSDKDIYFICEWGEVEKETTITQNPTITNKDTTKDSTTAKDKLPNTGRVLLIWIIGIVAASGTAAYVRYKKLYM